MKKLSIITINFNNINGLKKTVESVINQSHVEFEYIVIDGGSIDGSKEYIQENEDKITFWVSEPDSGIYNAMNKGIRKANGEFLLFLNSGDYLFDKDILNKLIIRAQGFDIVYGDLIFEGDAKKFAVGNILDLKYFLHSTIGHAASIIKRDLFNSIGFYNENNKIVSDWEFFVKAVVVHNVKYLHIGEVISVYQKGGISTNKEYNELQIIERKNFLKAQFAQVYGIIEENNKLRDALRNYYHSSLIKGLFTLVYSKIFRKPIVLIDDNTY